MPYLRLKNGIEKHSDAKLLEFANYVHECISTRTATFTNPTPAMPVFKEAINEFRTAVSNALQNSFLVGDKNAKRLALIDLVHRLGYYAVFISGGDPLIVMAAGFTPAKAPSPRIISKPDNLRVIATDQDGELLVSVNVVSGAESYLHQYTTDPEKREGTWTSKFCTASKCLITGLTPGVVYHFRVVAVGTRDQIKYSDVISKMAA